MTADNGNGDLDPETVAELRRVARSRPRSGREALAKVSAIRTLERLSRQDRRPPPLPCPPGWHPGPSEWEELDRVYWDENPQVRHRMWERFYRNGRI